LVDSSGKIIWPDLQMMVFAADVLSREPGADIIYDVKCSRNLPDQILKNGGQPIMARTGHAPMKAKLKETGAMLAGEMSGHIFFQERWYGFDDAIYASARMIEILSNKTESSAVVFDQLPGSIHTPELGVLLKEGENLAILAKLIDLAEFSDAHITDIDGLRVDFHEGWGLVRASNTLPALTFRFEADSEKALAHIQQQFKDLLLQVKPDIKLPF
jgi:phosphomannomutase/phosphoglucomutase